MENKEFLQVNHVCPYLPYKLKIIDGWGNRRTMRASEFLFPLPKMTRIMEYLYSIHADVYGLIDKGLAVDIKTIKE